MILPAIVISTDHAHRCSAPGNLAGQGVHHSMFSVFLPNASELPNPQAHPEIMKPGKQTHAVSDTVFKAVYDTPASLPGRHKWFTRDNDVRKLEELLGMPPETIGAPLWLSGDRKRCAKCSREINWLHIVSSALGPVHAREIIARVILGTQKYVNTEAPRAIAVLTCFSARPVHRQPAELQMPQLGLRQTGAIRSASANGKTAKPAKV
jgi:hypothetical protein